MDATDWQEFCTRQLVDAARTGGRGGRELWDLFRSRHSDGTRRIVIADQDFRGLGFEGYDLSRCWIGRCVFDGCNLRNVTFFQTIFRECSAHDAIIEGANFQFADLKDHGLSLMTEHYDSNTNFEVKISRLPFELSRGLRDKAERSDRERVLQKQQSRSSLMRFVIWLTDYGYSFSRIWQAAIAIIIAFSLVFWVMGRRFPDAVAASIQYFFSVSDRFDDSLTLSLLGTAEAILGLLLLAVLTSMIVSKIVDK